MANIESQLIRLQKNVKEIVNKNPNASVGIQMIEIFSEIVNQVNEECSDEPIAEKTKEQIDELISEGISVTYADLYAMAGQMLSIVRS